MADLMVLIIIIIFMYMLINEIEEHFILLMIGLLFMILGIDVINQIATGSYDKLFTASIPGGSGSIQQYGIMAFFSTIPIFAFSKVVIRRMQNKKSDQSLIPED